MTHDRSDSGFAQILVIASLAVLAAILTVAVASARLGGQQISALDAQVFADATLRSGLARLGEALDDPADDLETRALMAPVTIDVAGRPVELSIVGEGGKIDVLRGDAALVERFALNVGVVHTEIIQLLEALAVRRKLGDDVGAFGVVQFALVTAIGFAAVDESFTRFGSDRIDPTFASEAVLRAVPDLDAAQLMRLLAAAPTDRAPYAAASRYFTSGSRRFTLVARLSEKPGQRFERRLPIEVTSSGGVIELDRMR